MHFKLGHKRERRTQELWKVVAQENIHLIKAKDTHKQRRHRLKRLQVIDSDFNQIGLDNENYENFFVATHDVQTNNEIG